MKELNFNEVEMVSAGILPALVGYYLYMGSSISSVYGFAKWLDS